MDLDEGSSPWGDVPSSRASPNHHKPAGESESTAQPSEPSSLSASTEQVPRAPVRSPGGRGPRTVRRYGTQPTKLEAVDDPLGPLGLAPADEPPVPPQKEQVPPRGGPLRQPASPTPAVGNQMDSVHLEDDEDGIPRRARVPPPVQPAQSTEGGARRQTQPSVSVEQAAKPSFNITVGDPHKVGGPTSSHTVYQVRTKTTSKGYKNADFVVSRRYRDFLWLYETLHNNSPGVVIPPPPEKQAVGRFDANFVESRRQALERMLNKIAGHPILQHDGDLKLFLESEAFNVDVKNKERRDPLLQQESKGMFSSIGLGSGSSKFIEHDDWFHDRRIYLDALENQLKALDKAVDTIVSQRKGLAEACGDFSASLHSLASVELSASLSGPLDGLSDLQFRIRELYDRQAQQDVLTLGIVIDEYVRIIGSIKTAFNQRQKAYHAWHAAESELMKRKSTQEKLLRQGRSQQDRLNQLGADVAEAERRVHQARLLFEDMGRLMRAELERFEREKVEDFKSGVETYLESAVEAQKELIELWETYLMQLDAEDGDPAPPVGVVAAPSKRDASAAAERPESQGTDASEVTEAHAAAQLTREIEE